MKFDLIDSVVERSESRIVAVKQVSRAEEYLADHFPGFPILPGVLMIETMVQAARMLLASRDPAHARLVLGEVKALKFGNMVRPGEALQVEVEIVKHNDDGSFACRGAGLVKRPSATGGSQADQTAVSGKFTLRPMQC